MNQKLAAMVAEFNRYFTIANGVDVGERVSGPRDERRALHAAISGSGEAAASVSRPSVGRRLHG